MTMNRSRKKTKKKHPVRNAILIILGLFLVTGTALAAVFYQTARVNVDKTYAPLESSKDQAEATQAISESRPDRCPFLSWDLIHVMRICPGEQIAYWWSR